MTYQYGQGNGVNLEQVQLTSWHGKMSMSQTGTMWGKHDIGTVLLFAKSGM
jgi:hypothetical protein